MNRPKKNWPNFFSKHPWIVEICPQNEFGELPCSCLTFLAILQNLKVPLPLPYCCPFCQLTPNITSAAPAESQILMQYDSALAQVSAATRIIELSKPIQLTDPELQATFTCDCCINAHCHDWTGWLQT